MYVYAVENQLTNWYTGAKRTKIYTFLGERFMGVT